MQAPDVVERPTISPQPIPDGLRLTPEQVELDVKQRTRIVPAPPAGFDPLTASDAVLARAGYPRRPDPATEPAAAKRWTTLLSRPMRVVTPGLQVNHGRYHGPVKPGPRASSGNSTNGTWSGSVASAPANKKFSTVYGSWTVPHPFPPASAWNAATKTWTDGEYHSSTWVGIDGYGTSDVLQAGTEQYVVVSGGKITTTGIYAWHEWFSSVTNSPEVQFTGFAVSPGDLIHCVVCATTSTQGSVAIYNEAAQTSMSVNMTAPANTSVTGATAEWIMERPSHGAVPNLTPYTLPDFGSDTFYQCGASGSQPNVNGSSFSAQPGSGTLLNMVDGATTVSTVVAVTPTMLFFYSPGDAP